MGNENIEQGFIADDEVWIRARARTAKEASELLQGLRTAYQSLCPDDRREVKNLMSAVFDSQRRFGSIDVAMETCWSNARVNA